MTTSSINEDLDRAFGSVKAIVAAERLRRDRRPGLFDFVVGLLDEKTILCTRRCVVDRWRFANLSLSCWASRSGS